MIFHEYINSSTIVTKTGHNEEVQQLRYVIRKNCRTPVSHLIKMCSAAMETNHTVDWIAQPSPFTHIHFMLFMQKK
jgi:hypothetical protein